MENETRTTQIYKDIIKTSYQLTFAIADDEKPEIIDSIRSKLNYLVDQYLYGIKESKDYLNKILK